MNHDSFWEEGLNHQWVLNAADNSSLDLLYEKVAADTILIPTNEDPTNLGIRKVNGKLVSGNYVGLCRLKNIYGKDMVSYDGREVILRIRPRFSLSIIDMLNAIKEDDEFERYLAPQTLRLDQDEREIEDLSRNELFTFFDKDKPIKTDDGIAKSSSIITATVFLSLLKQLCSRPLMGRMVSKEENLVGKAKGKILVKQNIRQNSVQGRDDRLYCRYLQYSEDILPNQILKCALKKASNYVNTYFSSVTGASNSYRDIILYCQRSLYRVTERNIAPRDYQAVNVTGLFAYYRPVINAAKMVLQEVSFEANGMSKITGYIIPYAVSMSRLFEIYVRANLKHAGVETYSAQSNKIRLCRYDEKMAVLTSKGNGVAHYIQGNIKPDILLYDPQTNQYVVFDVKYKDVTNNRHSRLDRLQLLAYALMYDCKHVGIIFPSQDGINSVCYGDNLINDTGTYSRSYSQFELAISYPFQTMLHSTNNGLEVSMYDFLRSLFCY